MDDKNTLPQPKPLRNERSDDFGEVYANNVLFETSVWDLKVIFGQLDQAMGVVQQHTAVTIPWTIAKLALYHLQSQVAAYEIVYGPIKLSSEILPVEPGSLEPPFKGNAVLERVHEEIKKLHKEFISANRT